MARSVGAESLHAQGSLKEVVLKKEGEVVDAKKAELEIDTLSPAAFMAVATANEGKLLDRLSVRLPIALVLVYSYLQLTHALLQQHSSSTAAAMEQANDTVLGKLPLPSLDATFLSKVCHAWNIRSGYLSCSSFDCRPGYKAIPSSIMVLVESLALVTLWSEVGMAPPSFMISDPRQEGFSQHIRVLFVVP